MDRAMKQNAAAFTLIELVVAITAAGLFLGFAAYLIVQSTSHNAELNSLNRAAELADLYMGEVIATGRWDELSYSHRAASGTIPLASASIGPDEPSRAQYDDCDDYHGFSASGAHASKSGASWGERFAPFTTQIEVSYINFDQLQTTSTPTDLKRITVTVTWNSQDRFRLAAILANI